MLSVNKKVFIGREVCKIHLPTNGSPSKPSLQRQFATWFLGKQTAFAPQGSSIKQGLIHVPSTQVSVSRHSLSDWQPKINRKHISGDLLMIVHVIILLLC